MQGEQLDGTKDHGNPLPGRDFSFLVVYPGEFIGHFDHRIYRDTGWLTCNISLTASLLLRATRCQFLPRCQGTQKRERESEEASRVCETACILVVAFLGLSF